MFIYNKISSMDNYRFMILCRVVTWINTLQNAVTIMDNTVVLYKEGVIIELRRLTKQQTISMHHRELQCPTTKTLYQEKIAASLSSFQYDLNLAKFFSKHANVIMWMSGHGYVMLSYDINHGFRVLPEEHWHVLDLAHYKQRSPDAWINEYFLPYFL